MGKSDDSSFIDKCKVKLNHQLNSVFTKFVPSLARMHNNAFVLATSDKDNQPASRVVLLKEYSQKGYVFYTNYNSEKSKALLENPVASMNFFWSYPTRQVRIVGQVEKVPYEQSNAYWQSRPRGSREGALVSDQSKKLESYDELIKSLENVKEKYKGKEIPCPKHWGGFIIKPTSYEFWQAMPSRLHKRVRCTHLNKKWQKTWLNP